MFKEASQRRIKRTVASPEAGEWQDALAAKLLDQTSLRKDDTQDVAKGRERNKDRQSTLGRLAIHVAEKRSSHETLRLEDLLLGDGSKVGNVGEHIQDGNRANGQRRGKLESARRVLGLAKGIVGVAIADVAPNDIVQRRDNTICASRGALKRLGKGVVLADLFEIDERRDNDEYNDENLDYTQQIL